MSVSPRHLLAQGPVLAAVGRVALKTLEQRWRRPPFRSIVLPSPTVTAQLDPRPKALVDAYVRAVGAPKGAYRDVLPAHLFPQWSFPLAARSIEGIPYDLARVLNGGCRIRIDGDLPRGRPLDVSATLEDIDDDGRRAILHQKIITGTPDSPAALTAELFAWVPARERLSEGRASKGRERARVPVGARELDYWRLSPSDALDFAMLTGDFNPVHWVPPVARAAGFPGTILHGFATMARSIEGLNRGLWAGDTRRLAGFECRFTRPLVLPARVGLYVDDQQGVFVGDAPGGAAYLVGSYTER